MKASSARMEPVPEPGARGRTRVCVIGACEGLPELVQALGGHDDVDIVGESEYANAIKTLQPDEVDVVLYATDAGPGWMDELTAIREHTRAPVVLLSSSRSGALLDEALEAGVAEALLLPQLVENVAFAVRRSSRSGARAAGAARPETDLGRVVTVFSPKGGIGKTVMATNLAAIFAKDHGKRTLLVDLDLQFGDTAIVIGVEPEKTLHDLVSAPGELDAEKLAGYTTRHESGLDILPAPLRPQDADLVSDAKLARLLEVARGSYDVIVIDTAPFLHGPILTALDQTSDLLLICSPEVPTLKDVHLSLQTLKLLSFPVEKVRLVINHAHGNGGLKRDELEDALGVKVAFDVPNDRIVSDAVNRGMPAVFVDPRTEFAQAVRGLGAGLYSVEAPQQSPRRWLPQLGRKRR